LTSVLSENILWEFLSRPPWEPGLPPPSGEANAEKLLRWRAPTPIPQEDTAMKKLALKLEELSVESFRTEEAAKERGTVPAHCGLATDCWINTCNDTCQVKCNGGSLSFCCPCEETQQDTCTEP
jgi:hypothetical protein